MAGAVPDIPGKRAPADAARGIQEQVMYLLDRKSRSFPGAQPVSFARKHLQQDLVKDDYFVCEKSDGIRCLMFLTVENQEEKVYLITRRNEVYFIPDLHVPDDKGPSSFHDGTLIDGELVSAQTPQGWRLKYLMFDMLAYNGKPLVGRILDSRLGYLKEFVYKPFQKLVTEFPEDSSRFPFFIYMKPMSFSYGLEAVLKAKRSHLSDGLIFTSRTTPYRYGTDPHIVKWKPPEENSIDFMLDLEFHAFKDPDTSEEWTDYDSLPTSRLLAWHGGNKEVYFDDLYLTDDKWLELKALEQPLNRRIVECIMDENHRWRFLRFRDDKDHGNHIDTVESVMESIRDHITENLLLEAVEPIRSAWHERDDKRAAAKAKSKPDSRDPKADKRGSIDGESEENASKKTKI